MIVLPTSDPALKALSDTWKNEDALVELRDALDKAHQDSARRDNLSNQVFQTAFAANGQNALQALAASISCMGGNNLPVMEAQLLLHETDPADSADNMIAHNMKVPGFGSPYMKGADDVLLQGVADALEKISPETDELIWSIQKVIGKGVFPNIAIYTAAYAKLAGIPAPLSPLLVVEARTETMRDMLSNKYK
jgi:hypothetical protein